jgi:crotonobetainyl-CoA:carnitine CoA-transferase CaiB-like acyl-CoA transferase
VAEDEQAWANDVLTKIPYANGGKIMPTNPIRFGSLGTPEYVIGGSQGAHSIEIMKHLGYSDAEIEEIIASGAVEGAKGLRKL